MTPIKTPAEITDDLAEKTAQLAEQLLEERFPGLYKHVEASEVPPYHREAVRQALKDLLDYAIAEVKSEKLDPYGVKYTTMVSPEEAIAYTNYDRANDDCIAVLNKLKESV